MKRVVVTAMVVSLALSPSRIVAAQEEAKDERVVALERQKAYYEARSAAHKAQADAVAAKIAPLTALAGDGKTSLGSGAGGPEAWFLTREAIAVAAGQIKTAVLNAQSAAKLPEGTPIVVLAGDEALNLSLAPAIQIESDSVQAAFEQGLSIAPPSCVTRTSSSPGFITALGAIGSLLKTSTDVQGLDVEASHRLLSFAVASRFGGHALIPAALKLPAVDDSKLAKKLDRLRAANQDALMARTCIGDDKKHAGAAKLLDEAKSHYDTFTQRIATADEAGKSQLTEALVTEAIASRNPTILRVYVDKAGGTLINKQNILTAVGFPAVGVTGGLVASYIATNPATGQVVVAGTMGCATSLRTLRQAHRIYASSTATATCSH